MLVFGEQRKACRVEFRPWSQRRAVWIQELNGIHGADCWVTSLAAPWEIYGLQSS